MPDTQKFLDNAGLVTLWANIKNTFVAKEAGKGLSTNDFTDALNTKLSGIAEGAEVNQNAFSNVSDGTNTITAGAKTDTVTFEGGGIVSVAADSATKTVTISATAVEYDDATQSVHGLMSTADKIKLDGIDASADVNQDAFSSVKVGATTISAASTTDELELVQGANITFTPDAVNKSITIAATDTTYSVATTSADGLMSSTDKSKLDGVATGAEANVIEEVQVNGTALTPSNEAVNITIAEGATNGTLAVNGTDVAVHGLGTAAYADTESTVANDSGLPTGAAVQSYVTGLGYQTASDVQTAINTAIASAYIYKGSVATESDLPASGNTAGDVYNIVAASSYGPAGMNVAWTGSAWDALGSSISIEAMTDSEINAICV